MNYLFTIAYRRIKNNLRLNLYIFVQMLLGVFLLTIFVNISVFIQDEYNDYIKSNESKCFRLYANSVGESCENKIYFDRINNILETKLVEAYSINILYDVITFAGRTHLDETREEIFDRYVIRYTTQYDSIIVENEFLRVLGELNENNTVNYDDVRFQISSDEIVFSNNDRVKYTVRDMNYEENYHVIILPIKYYYEYTPLGMFTDCFIEMNFGEYDLEEMNQIICSIEAGMQDENPQFTFTLSSEFYDFLYNASFDANQTKFFSCILIMLMIIVYIGIISFLVMLIEKRKFEIAVCLALGASKKQIFFELAFEFLSLSMLPAVLGILIANCILVGGFTLVNILVSGYSLAADFSIILSILSINVVCLSWLFIRIIRLKPQEILYLYEGVC